MGKKIYVIKANDEDELAKNINEFCLNHDVFATQPMQKNNNSWCAFVYVNDEFKRTTQPTQANKEELATEKQKYVLEKNGVAIPQGLTKAQAIPLIKEIKESKQ